MHLLGHQDVDQNRDVRRVRRGEDLRGRRGAVHRDRDGTRGRDVIQGRDANRDRAGIHPGHLGEHQAHHLGGSHLVAAGWACHSVTTDAGAAAESVCRSATTGVPAVGRRDEQEPRHGVPPGEPVEQMVQQVLASQAVEGSHQWEHPGHPRR